MPIHDWTRVTAGTWHAFHLSWISEIQLALNSGVLPPDHYAQAEQIAGRFGPDVLALQTSGPPPTANGHAAPAGGSGGVAVATAPPRARLTAEAEEWAYLAKQNAIVVRHASGDRVVALIELMSPGNKSSRDAIDSFVGKASEALAGGYHLLVVDLFPPGRRDPNGIHAAIWAGLGAEPFHPPEGEPLTLAAYAAGATARAFVEPTAVGRELLEMPLFLTPDTYVNVPLEPTYTAAYRGVPERWRRVLA